MADTNNCDPCSSALNENESVNSQLTNLVTNLFGTLTKTVTNGRAVWAQPCDAYDSLTNFPRNDGEGLMCYFLRIFTSYYAAFKGIWSIANAYALNDVVVDTYSFYQAKSAVPVGVAIGNTTYWLLLLTAPAGPTGATGPAGSGSAINYAVTTKTAHYTASDTDAVIFVDPAAATTITLPAANAVSGKWYKIVNRTGAFAVTVIRAGADTLDGGTSIVLTYANESTTVINDNSTKWSSW